MSFALQEANSAGTERLLARTDELTGLANRRNFLAQLEAMKTGYIFLLDLDGFKKINDTFGHEAGDQLLKQVASRFMRVIPADSHLARLGGDEFGIITPINSDEAAELGQAIRATLSYPISLNSEQVQVGVSVGITRFNSALTSSELLHQADQMMYEAKRNKAGVRIWSE
jgi:diguanylate cyclase (GGDEF)-like protein